jgi:HSP90 family molecular chaperone
MEPGYDLYCRRVLVQKAPRALLPPWLRFMKGVVDCEDIPLNVRHVARHRACLLLRCLHPASRELLQDSALLRRVGGALTSRILQWFAEWSASDPVCALLLLLLPHHSMRSVRSDACAGSGYAAFFEEYGFFLKEGVWSDFANKVPDVPPVVAVGSDAAQDTIAPLLQYETNLTAAGQRITLDEYLVRISVCRVGRVLSGAGVQARMNPHQKDIYYICSPSREHALSSPYLEVLTAKRFEVLLGLHPVDEMVMQALIKYAGRPITAAELAKARTGRCIATERRGADGGGGAS